MDGTEYKDDNMIKKIKYLFDYFKYLKNPFSALLFKFGQKKEVELKIKSTNKTVKVNDVDIATRVSVQLQLTDPTAKSRDRVVKKSEKPGFYTALDVGCVWLERALAGK